MCIFCSIVKGEIPSYKIYEDDKVLAFLDIKPVNPGHCLVIPKKHLENIEEIDEEYLSHLVKIVKKIGNKIKNNLNVLGYNVQVNNDPIAGQEIAHLHFHIIPRQKNDNLKLFPQKNYNSGEAEEIVKKLIKE